MDGILIIDKPGGWTSHDVVARMRRILKTKKIGHTGTLDPFATGVLVMLVGKATRLAQFLDKDEKEYEAVVRFGFETDTGDRTGSARESLEAGSKSREEGPRSRVPGPKQVSVADIEKVLPMFRGEISQVPPMYSAKKVEGKKLYELARKGIEVERKAVAVVIHKLEVFEMQAGPKSEENLQADLGPWTLDTGLRVACSAGTYIRTLAEDIGRAAGSAAHLAELRRTRAGRFDLARAVTLEQLEKLENVGEILVPMNEAVSHLAEVRLGADETAKIRNGVKIPASSALPDPQTVRLTDPDGELIAIAVHEEGILRPRLVF